MALRNQPYLPLYVQDYLTDEKLNMCSLESQGVFIKIMCILHKQNEYGTLLLKQNDKQNSSTCFNFAYKFAKLLPIQVDILTPAIKELVDEGVLGIEGDKLFQKRMVHDNKISLIRSKVGKKGGEMTQSFAKAKVKAKVKQNTEYEYEDVIEYDNVIKNKVSKKNKLNIEFEKFWNLYDKKVSKKKSIKLWNKLTDDERSLIIEYIPKYKEAQTDKTFRKNPDGFLLNRGWEDEIVIKQPISSSRGTCRQAVTLSEKDKEQYR